MKIEGMSNALLSVPEAGSQRGQDPLSGFKETLTQSIQELNQLSNAASLKIQEMVTGEADIHEAMIAMEKAGISFRLMLQVRNKVLSAYEEIMRMQF